MPSPGGYSLYVTPIDFCPSLQAKIIHSFNDDGPLRNSTYPSANYSTCTTSTVCYRSSDFLSLIDIHFLRSSTSSILVFALHMLAIIISSPSYTIFLCISFHTLSYTDTDVLTRDLYPYPYPYPYPYMLLFP